MTCVPFLGTETQLIKSSVQSHKQYVMEMGSEPRLASAGAALSSGRTVEALKTQYQISPLPVSIPAQKVLLLTHSSWCVYHNLILPGLENRYGFSGLSLVPGPK